MKRRDALKSIGAVVTAALASGLWLAPVCAQSKMVLKATDVHPLGYPTVEAVVRMGKKLEDSHQRPHSASRCIPRCNSAARRR